MKHYTSGCHTDTVNLATGNYTWDLYSMVNGARKALMGDAQKPKQRATNKSYNYCDLLALSNLWYLILSSTAKMHAACSRFAHNVTYSST